MSAIVLIAMFASLALLVGCGAKKDKAATQVAAKVNKEEISVHQINFMLQQQRGLKPEQADAASRQVLDRLIEQELAVQKATAMRLDRDPRVVQQLEAARREIIARAYIEKAGESASRPTPEEVSQYYQDKPSLFKERRIYSIQELAIDAKPDQVDGLRSKLQESKSIGDFAEYLKASNFRFAANQAVRPAEQLPLNMLDTFAKMKDGQAMLIPSANGAQVVVLAGSRSDPIDEVKARPAIEQFLFNERKRKIAEAEMKSLREGGRIEYVGRFADAASQPAAGAASASQAVVVQSPPGFASAAEPSGAGGKLDNSAISKGLSGLK